LNLTKLIEDNRILISTFDFGTERVDGRSILTDDKHPVILTNKIQLGDRQRFTLAYELGHLIMHAFHNPSLGTDVGHEANVFAAEFLMPEKDIISDFKTTITLELLAELKKKWKVSMQALLYRACDLNLLTYNQQRYLIAQFNQLKIRRREPPEFDVPREIPTLLRDLVTKYRSKQKMNITEMAAFFNLTESEFMKMYS
jgi:Zn-dependent peptidase ImmA (M78 family)